MNPENRVVFVGLHHTRPRFLDWNRVHEMFLPGYAPVAVPVGTFHEIVLGLWVNQYTITFPVTGDWDLRPIRFFSLSAGGIVWQTGDITSVNPWRLGVGDLLQFAPGALYVRFVVESAVHSGAVS